MNAEITATNGNGQTADMLYPSFILNRADGVFVDLSLADAAEGGMVRFIDRLFGAGARFSGLNYDLFLKLLFDREWLAESAKTGGSVKLAESIVRFPDSRRVLYRTVKMGEGDKRADYVFEPIHIEETYQEPIYGPVGADGVVPIVGHETKMREISAKLDFDEMVADMWLKGIKFGLREETIRKLIASGDTARLPIAMHAEPEPSVDAEIVEVCDKLHRDNSPEIGSHGKANLAVFKNRFPHVAAGTRLLKKVPRRLGKPGHKVTGEIIEPNIPKDLDLSRLSSAGTRVEHGEDGEFIIAAIDGFIGIDAKSNRISITEKIETKDGISAKTTGNLVLNADEFVEHGEVQEGRVVKGKHMTFLSDVFGNILSDGGNIYISGNVAGGRIESIGGNVTLAARMTRAVAVAKEGVLEVAQAESSLIVGRVVRIQNAVNCEIVAEELQATRVEGCVIVGKNIRISSAGERRGAETLVTVLLPDSAAAEQRIKSMNAARDEAKSAVAAKVAAADALKADADFAKFLGLYSRIQRGEIKLTEEQAANWQKMVVKNTKPLQQLAGLNKERSALEQGLKEIEDGLVEAEQALAAMSEGMGCSIDEIDGHTVVQTMQTSTGLPAFFGMTGGAIRHSMHTMDASKTKLFIKDGGSVEWKPAAEKQGQ